MLKIKNKLLNLFNKYIYSINPFSLLSLVIRYGTKYINGKFVIIKF